MPAGSSRQLCCGHQPRQAEQHSNTTQAAPEQKTHPDLATKAAALHGHRAQRGLGAREGKGAAITQASKLPAMPRALLPPAEEGQQPAKLQL